VLLFGFRMGLEIWVSKFGCKLRGLDFGLGLVKCTLCSCFVSWGWDCEFWFRSLGLGLGGVVFV